MKKHVLSAASGYTKKYFENPEYQDLPKAVRDEVKKICAFLADKTGGIAVIGFLSGGAVYIEMEKMDNDSNYDEAEARHLVNQMQRERADFITALSKWFLMFKTEEGKAAQEGETPNA